MLFRIFLSLFVSSIISGCAKPIPSETVVSENETEVSHKERKTILAIQNDKFKFEVLEAYVGFPKFESNDGKTTTVESLGQRLNLIVAITNLSETKRVSLEFSMNSVNLSQLMKDEFGNIYPVSCARYQIDNKNTSLYPGKTNVEIWTCDLPVDKAQSFLFTIKENDRQKDEEGLKFKLTRSQISK